MCIYIQSKNYIGTFFMILNNSGMGMIKPGLY